MEATQIYNDDNKGKQLLFDAYKVTDASSRNGLSNDIKDYFGDDRTFKLSEQGEYNS
jgi:hypothetical protein